MIKYNGNFYNFTQDEKYAFFQESQNEMYKFMHTLLENNFYINILFDTNGDIKKLFLSDDDITWVGVRYNYEWLGLYEWFELTMYGGAVVYLKDDYALFSVPQNVHEVSDALMLDYVYEILKDIKNSYAKIIYELPNQPLYDAAYMLKNNFILFPSSEFIKKCFKEDIHNFPCRPDYLYSKHTKDNSTFNYSSNYLFQIKKEVFIRG